MNISDIERLLDNSATIETKIEILPRYAGESLITITNDDSIKSWEYADTRYVPDNGFIGMFVERTLEGELHNITSDFNIENREIILYLGIRVYDVDSKTYTTTFYSLGNFIVDKPESDEVKDNTKFTAKDYTIMFNVNFNPDYTDDEYAKSFTNMLSEQGSVTALWLAKYTCKQCGVELGNEDFTNSDFAIDSNQFQNGEQCRDIIKAIAKLACSWARIDWDNKVYIDFYVKDSVEYDYNNITKDDYYELTVQKDTYGPVNKVVFGSSIIEGDYSFVSNSESIAINGENSFVINDNPILYTEEIRERAVQNASTLLGLQYTPLEVETTGHPWLKGNELISVQDSADNLVYTYPLDRVIEYDGHIKTLITSYAPTKVAENYTYSGTGTSKNTQRQTKIILDRANQQLQTLVEKTDEQGSKITSLTQDLDSVNITVSNVQKDLETTNSNLESTNNNVDDLQSQIQGVSADFEDFKDNEYVQSIDNLQKQIDGAIQFWNGADIPTLDNYPANEWTTEVERVNHQADIYTVIQDVEGELKQGKAYRFDKVDGVWQWIELTDNELSAVQEIAQNALKQANTNATDITTLKQTDTEIKANIEGIQLNYNTLNNQFESTVITSKTIEGNPIHITDAGDYDLDRLYLEGNSYQETTSGVNLIDWSKPDTLNGATYTFKDDVLIVSNTEGSYRSVYWDITELIKNNPNKKLCLHWDSVVQTITGSGTCNLQLINNGTTSYPSLSYSSGGTTYYQIPSDTSGITSCKIRIMSNNTSTSQAGSVTITKPMLYFGELNNPPEYEPYTNGASPNPDYPQEIEVIEGSVDVEVVGKNLFDKDNANILKLIPSGGSNMLFVSSSTNASIYIPITGGKTYTVSRQVVSNRFSVATSENIPILSGALIDFATNNSANYLRIATSSNAKYLCVYLSNDGSNFDKALNSIQIEESSKATEYEEHKSTTASLDLQNNFLAKIGDVYDELDVVTGKLTKRIGKVVLNGSESWVKATNYYYWRVADKFPLVSGGSTTPNLINTHFVPRCFDYLYDALVDYGIALHYSTSQLAIRHKDITTLEEFKTWLSSNNVEVYYALAEPYEVQLDSTSIELNEGVNNIYIKTNIGPSFISLTYLTDSILNSQYATKTQLQLTKDSIQSVVKDTTTLNANLTDLQAVVGTETTNLKNALGDLSNNLEENYATNNSVLTIENSVSNIQTSLNQQIEITKDIQVNGVSKVKTTTGFTFDENGMTITKTNADTKTTIDEDGMVVYSTTGAENTEILVADAQGVKAENVEVRTYLVVGQNSRFQDYSTGTGCFWVGK